jgi:ribonuclease P protein component
VSQLERLRGAEEFRRVYRSGCRATGAVGTVYAVPNHRGVTRVGVQVGRRFGSAVRRNRARRRLREALREMRGQLASGVDLVIVPRASVLVMESSGLRRQLAEVLVAVGALTSGAA